MKIFWSIVALLALVTVVIGVSSRRPKEKAVVDRPGAPIAAPVIREKTPEPDAPVPLPPPPSPPPVAVDEIPAAAAPPDEDTSIAADDSTAISEATPDSEFEEEPLDEEMLDDPEADVAAEPDSVSDTTASATSPSPRTGFKIERQPDGSLLLDDKFTVRGSGTQSDPYRITWELLLSAEATYAPRLDLYEMPERISFLNGKHVRIAGFIYTATYRAGTSELLLMRNMWDGCCIGEPPTSYDAIEVTLTEPLSAAELDVASFGTLDGVLKVDPFLQDNWLLGLYIVENGKVYVGDF